MLRRFFLVKYFSQLADFDFFLVEDDFGKFEIHLGFSDHDFAGVVVDFFFDYFNQLLFWLFLPRLAVGMIMFDVTFLKVCLPAAFP